MISLFEYKFIKKITIYFVCLSFIFVPRFSFCQDEFCESVEEGAMVRRIYQQTIKAFEKFGKVIRIGTGCSTNIDVKYTRLHLSLDLYQPLSENEARQMIVEAANIYLSITNKDKKFIENYAEKSFTIENIDLAFFLKSQSGKDLYDPNISEVDIYDGIINYCTENTASTFGYKDIFAETYEEAVQKLKEAKAGEPTREELTKKALSR